MSWCRHPRAPWKTSSIFWRSRSCYGSSLSLPPKSASSCLRRPVGLPSPLYERTHRETDAQEVYLTLQLLGNNGKPLIPETTVPRIQCVPFPATAALLP